MLRAVPRPRRGADRQTACASRRAVGATRYVSAECPRRLASFRQDGKIQVSFSPEIETSSFLPDEWNGPVRIEPRLARTLAINSCIRVHEQHSGKKRPEPMRSGPMVDLRDQNLKWASISTVLPLSTVLARPKWGSVIVFTGAKRLSWLNRL
jgi:hypothetical protein